MWFLLGIPAGWLLKTLLTDSPQSHQPGYLLEDGRRLADDDLAEQVAMLRNFEIDDAAGRLRQSRAELDAYHEQMRKLVDQKAAPRLTAAGFVKQSDGKWSREHLAAALRTARRVG